jgi:hypothetical protein
MGSFRRVEEVRMAASVGRLLPELLLDVAAPIEI